MPDGAGSGHAAVRRSHQAARLAQLEYLTDLAAEIARDLMIDLVAHEGIAPPDELVAAIERRDRVHEQFACLRRRLRLLD